MRTFFPLAAVGTNQMEVSVGDVVDFIPFEGESFFPDEESAWALEDKSTKASNEMVTERPKLVLDIKFRLPNCCHGPTQILHRSNDSSGESTVKRLWPRKC